MGLSYIDASAGPRMDGWKDMAKSYGIAAGKAVAGAAAKKLVGGGGSKAAAPAADVAPPPPEKKSKLKPILIGVGILGALVLLFKRKKR